MAHRYIQHNVPPPMNLRVAIRESKPASPTMVTGRDVNNVQLLGVHRIPPSHAGTPLTIVNAVHPLVQEDKGHRRPRLDEVRGFRIDGVAGRPADILGVVSVEP